MSASQEKLVEQIVGRYFERRADQPRASLDDVLKEFPDAQGDKKLRTLSLHQIASQSRTRIAASKGDSFDVEVRVSDGAAPALPELHGYYIIDAVARGGMGSVYEAYQQSTGRRVAVKFMLPTMLSSETSRRRFEREVELVARLNHPHIVSILDSGVHEERYFFVMEFVEGRTLDEAVPPGRTNIRRALSVVRAIADAVDYAHQRGVLHRDLKPSNIVMDEHDQPHLLDFGLAKALDGEPDLLSRTSISQPGQLLGTLGYMSPEQARGDAGAISVRSDVYSLGAMAYELVTGKLPNRVDGALVDVLGRICEEEPSAPSALLAEADADVDAMLLKALDKEPDGRYATAGEFAADLDRYLAREPIAARRISVAARGWRWVRRHRAVSAISAAALAAIVIITTVSFVRISNARDRAEQMGVMLKQLFDQLDPDAAGGGEAKVRDFLDQVVAWLDSGIDAPGDVEAEIRETLGIMFLKLGPSKGARAQRQFERVMELRQNLRPPDEDLARGMLLLASSWYQQEKLEAAEPYFRRALDMRLDMFPEESVEVAESRHFLAACLDRRKKSAEAEPLLRQALATQIRLLGAYHEDTANTHLYYAYCLSNLGRHDDAISEARQAVSIAEKVFGTPHWRVAFVYMRLADILTKAKRWPEAEAQWLKAIDGLEAVYGPESKNVKEARDRLAELREKIANAGAAQLTESPPPEARAEDQDGKEQR